MSDSVSLRGPIPLPPRDLLVVIRSPWQSGMMEQYCYSLTGALHRDIPTPHLTRASCNTHSCISAASSAIAVL